MIAEANRSTEVSSACRSESKPFDLASRLAGALCRGCCAGAVLGVEPLQAVGEVDPGNLPPGVPNGALCDCLGLGYVMMRT